ncbi:MAG: DUF1571 domain-containing protein [Polyangiaceae bacterium]
MTVDERKKALTQIDRPELARLVASISQGTLVDLGRQGVAALPLYRTRLIKSERLRGKMLDPQTVEVTVREQPFAFRMDFVHGPNKGRRILYNAELRESEVRVKEAGVLGFAGAIWLGLDNPLTRGDTNHRATEIGFRALVDIIDADMKKAAAAGEFTRTDDSFDDAGVFSALFEAPKAAKGLYAVERTNVAAKFFTLAAARL